MVCRDGGVPLLSHAYEGNRHDVTQFADVVGELSARFGAVAEQGELTVVFDAGQDSEENLELIAAGPLHFVGSIPPSDHLDLMAVPKSRYKVVDAERFPGLSAFEATKVVFGAESRFVVTHSQDFHDEQARGFEQTLAKARRQLSELAGRLARGRGRKSRAQVEAEVAKIVRPRWLSRVVSTSLVGTTPSELRLSWRTKPAAKAALADELFGKRIIFTDRAAWSVADVVTAYRSQSQVEAVDLGHEQKHEAHGDAHHDMTEVHQPRSRNDLVDRHHGAGPPLGTNLWTIRSGCTNQGVGRCMASEV